MIDKRVSIFCIFSFSLFSFIICVNGQSRLIGSECWSYNDCNSVRYSYCENYRCVCYSPYVPSQNLSVCTIATGELCQTMSTVCYDNNARCNSTTKRYCECKDTFVQHTDTRVCLKAIGQNCTGAEVACVDGSCENGECQCPDPLVGNSFGNRCVTALGENCLESQECADPHATCKSNGPCICNDGFQQVRRADGSALCKRILGGTCDKDEDCADEDSFCESMRQGTVCNCREGYVRSTDMQKCLAVPLLWPGSCEEDPQCRAAFQSLSSCSNFTCGCPIGHEFSESSGECIPSAFVKLS